MFKDGRLNVHDEKRNGWPWVFVTEALVKQIDEKIRENRQLCFRLSFSKFLVLYCVTQERASTPHILCKMDSIAQKEQKSQRIASSLQSFEAYDAESDSLLDCIVTRDET